MNAADMTTTANLSPVPDASRGNDGPTTARRWQKRVSSRNDNALSRPPKIRRPARENEARELARFDLSDTPRAGGRREPIDSESPCPTRARGAGYAI